MKVKLTLKNYRCFRAEQPAIFEFGPGFTSFIGPNNAGKSSLLKFFYEVRHAIQHLKTLEEGSSTHGMFDGELVGLGGLPPPLTDPFEIVNENAKTQLQFQIEIETPDDPEIAFVKSAIWKYFPEKQSWSITLINSDGKEIQRHKTGSSNSTIAEIQSDFFVMQDGLRVEYRAILSAAHAVSNVQYFGPFRNAVNDVKLGSGDYYDLQLGSAFLERWHQWKTGGEKEKNRAIEKVTEDVRKLIGAKRLEINAATELKTLQILIDGRPHKLSELGAGIAQLIIVLGNALIRRPSFIAIDEPETHLHPALQLEFLTTLASYSTFGVIFATHSIGLARSISDRTYSVQSNEKGTVVRPYDKTPNYAEFLGSLGIAGLQDIGWTKVLLVEGTTDVRVYQQFLKKYGKDRHVVILPLGGDSMIHGGTSSQLEEVVRLCNTVFAIIDSERKSFDNPLDKGRLDFMNNCKKIGINCLVTERRATENYFTEKCVKQAFGSKYTALGDYGTFDASHQSWGKTENWRGAQEMTCDELNQTDLGKFLSKL